MAILKKIRYLHWQDIVYLNEALILSVIIKLIILIFPFRLYAEKLESQKMPLQAYSPDQKKHLIFKISQAIVRVRRITPWKNQCLTEAITAKWMLRRRNVSSTLFFGVSKDNNVLTAHAWLKCDEFFVTGRKGMHKFTTVRTFEG